MSLRASCVFPWLPNVPTDQCLLRASDFGFHSAFDIRLSDLYCVVQSQLACMHKCLEVVHSSGPGSQSPFGWASFFSFPLTSCLISGRRGSLDPSSAGSIPESRTRRCGRFSM